MTVAIIFDMDGVLIDVSRSLNLAIIRSAEEYCLLRGKKAVFTAADIHRIKNLPGYNDDWKVASRLASEVLKEDVMPGEVADEGSILSLFEVRYLGAGLFKELYGFSPKRRFPSLIDDEPLLIDRTLLSELSLEHPLAIFTGRPRDQALFALDRHGITGCFSQIITKDDCKKGKPSGEGLILLQRLIGFESAFYLGDNAQDDMLAAQEANKELGNSIIAVGVIPPACTDREELTRLFMKNGAETVLDHAGQISGLL